MILIQNSVSVESLFIRGNINLQWYFDFLKLYEYIYSKCLLKYRQVGTNAGEETVENILPPSSIRVYCEGKELPLLPWK